MSHWRGSTKQKSSSRSQTSTTSGRTRCDEILDAVRDFVRKEALFAGFPNDVRWERVALDPGEVLAIRYIDYDYWVELSGGSGQPPDAARRIREGMTVFGVPNDGFLEIASALATSQPLC